ncbi:MAG TPA: flavodoxin domain-containing protein [Candidatus Limnocylindria bacterium]|nr:flavodoxin domain-containing protein [Candidatus Limnocylindria bacterium]
MRILVAAASKHGATAEIGAAVGHALARHGHGVDLLPPAEVKRIEPYDAVILGSGVYAGHWLADAKELVERFADELRQRHVWLFSSGPLGDPPAPAGEPVDLTKVAEQLAPRGQMVFAGRLDRESLGFGERAIVALVKAPYGDFRDWQAIEQWAESIHAALVAEEQPVGQEQPIPQPALTA